MIVITTVSVSFILLGIISNRYLNNLEEKDPFLK